MHEYQQRGIPLDVLVMDMDWHITFYKEKGRDQVSEPLSAGDNKVILSLSLSLSLYGVTHTHTQAGQHIGWTGYTWDSYLFPEPKKFLDQ